MNPDREQFVKHQKKRAAEVADTGLSHKVAVIRQAAVKSNWLLNDSKWDTYLSWIQADIEEIEKVIESARLTLENPHITNHDDMMKAKIVLLESKAMLKALNIAITYPKKILENKTFLEDRKEDLKGES